MTSPPWLDAITQRLDEFRFQNVLSEARCDECGALWSDPSHFASRVALPRDGQPQALDCTVGIALRLVAFIETLAGALETLAMPCWSVECGHPNCILVRAALAAYREGPK